MNEEAIERAASVLAKLLPNAVGIHFNGEPCTAKWPNDFGPQEQAAFRLIARAMCGEKEARPGAATCGAHPSKGQWKCWSCNWNGPQSARPCNEVAK